MMKLNTHQYLPCFTDKPRFRFTFHIAKVRGCLRLSISLGNCFVFKSFWRPISLKIN